MKKRIFLTGATGFIGKNLLLHLPQLKKYDIVRLSRNPGPGILQGDIRDFEFPEGQFDYIFHGAATSSKIISDKETTSVIITGTERIVKFAETQNAKVIYISSGAIYGSYYTPVSERAACNPVTAYGKAKEAAEFLISKLDNYVIARCFAFVGEHTPLNEHFAIGNFIRDCLKNQPIIIKGDGTPIRSYMYTGDLANWLWELMLNETGIYNVGSNEMVSIAELARIVKEVAGTNNEIQILTPSINWKPAECYAPNIDKALGIRLENTVNLRQAIERTLKFYASSGLDSK